MVGRFSHLLLLLVFGSSLQNGRNVIGEAERLQSLGNVVARYGLLRFLLGDIVCLRRDESDELDTAFYEQVTSLL